MATCDFDMKPEIRRYQKELFDANLTEKMACLSTAEIKSAI